MRPDDPNLPYLLLIADALGDSDRWPVVLERLQAIANPQGLEPMS